VEAPLEIGKQDRHGLDALLVPQILEALFADLVSGNMVHAFMLGLEVEFFEFLVGKGKEIAVFGRHGSPSGEMTAVWAD
jgi:hypothetical protein